MRECAFCGQLFEEENGHQKFCSEDCRHQQRVLQKRIRRKKKQDSRGYRPKRSHLEWTDEDIQNRINTKSSKMIYCGGYVSSEDFMYLYCDDCGQPFKWSARGLRRQKPIQCDNCRNILSYIKEKEHKEEVLLNRETKKQQTKERRESEYISSHSKICIRCGKAYFGNPKSKYCSIKCQQRQRENTKRHLRRMRKNNNYHDIISTRLLAKRDNDTCWICKKKVDWTDFAINEKGYRITGRNFPSQDHVIPLAKGGTHTWDNVRLAHFKCNTEKGDNLFTQKKNGQIILFL